ncbi:MAG: fumarate hydratase C-terminal domain-containing protein, partial [Rhodobacterales bacterium]
MESTNRPREVRLSTTPSKDDLSNLKLGDIVYLDGLMYTAREGVYIRALEEKANIPMNLPSQSATNFHCSPAARINPDGTFEMGAVT